jgi:F0F1-type ATP synthase, subunit a
MKKLKNNIRRYAWILLLIFIPVLSASAEETKGGGVDVKEIVFGHIGDSYEWHITTWGETHISIPLPVIVMGSNGQWHVFLSSEFHHSPTGQYAGFYVAEEGQFKGKIVEKSASGTEVRPMDLSITKTAFAIILNSILLCVMILGVARWAKKSPNQAPKGFNGFMEMFIMDINDNVIKTCIGKGYERYAPYLLTVFFFIFFNNLMGLIPIFPGGANVTGNIAITLTLACCTLLAVNLFATKEYWKEIFWPDVPLMLKPIMIPIEMVGIITKPFALMIRLFANMMAGHSVILSLVCLVFITAAMGPVMNGSMTVVSVFFGIFMNILELLVAYIQAYVFTMLSAVFIGLSKVEPHHVK